MTLPSTPLAAGLLTVGLLLAGCASQSTNGAADPTPTPSATDSAPAASPSARAQQDRSATNDAGSAPAASASVSDKPGSAAQADQRDLPTLSDKSIVPNVTVKDVRSGEDVNLSSIVPNDKPILLWAWAPHCPSCRAEAGAVEAFAKRNAGQIDVIGVGTQDDFAYAQRFITDTGLGTPRMLWDPGFESWQRMGITVQPTSILITGSGEPVNGWVGPLPEGAVEEYLTG